MKKAYGKETKKERYEESVVEIIHLSNSDVIVTSKESDLGEWDENPDW